MISGIGLSSAPSRPIVAPPRKIDPPSLIGPRGILDRRQRRLPGKGPTATIAHWRMHAHQRTAAIAARYGLTAAAMERGLLAPLSPNEEVALRRISLGSIDIADAHLQRLVMLALIQRGPSGPHLTELGKQRLPRSQTEDGSRAG